MNHILKWNSQNSEPFYEQLLLILNDRIMDVAKSYAPFLIAIDGNCGSGKTTLARFLQTQLDCNLFHMDDFYLPWSLKTPERLNEPGGNVYYERFLEEVLMPLKSGLAFSYQPYDCKQEALMPAREVQPKRLNIVEGSYSMHPKLRDAYDYRLFLSVSESIQTVRILERNGVEGLKRFQDLWIPLENKYFESYKVSQYADLIIEVEEKRQGLRL